MRKSVVENWKEYLNSPGDYDKSDFFSLFTHDLNDIELEEIFKPFSYSEDLIERLKRVKASGTLKNHAYLFPLMENRGTKDQVLSLAQQHIQSLLGVCVQKNDSELCEIIGQAKPVYIEDKDQFDELLRSDLPHHWLFELISDEVIDSRKSKKYFVPSLFEAYYGLAGDYYLSWYLGQPILDVDIDFSHYFAFWRSGGECVLSTDALYVRHVL